MDGKWNLFKKQESKEKDDEKKANIFEMIWIQGTEVYLCLMLAVYPLFMGRGYGELIYRKWALFLYASAIFICISILGGLAVFMERRASEKKKMSGSGKSTGKLGKRWILTDWFVLIYMVCVVISYIGAVDHEAALWGITGWYMGLVSQILFVGIYYGISRGYTELKYLAVLTAVVGLIVAGMIVLQRFGIDVAYLYREYGEKTRRLFASTQGQITLTSNYMNILLVAGMGIYYMTENKRVKIFLAISIGVGFGAAILLNCDSGMIAVLAAGMVMLWLAIGNKKRLLALTEIVLVSLTATAVVGVLERIFAKRMVPIDTIYLIVPQSWAVYVLLAMVAAFYLLIKKDKLRVDAKKRTIRILRGIYVLLICLGIVGVAVLFLLHGKGYFAGSFTENYFNFNWHWGKGRGFMWHIGASVFSDFSPWRKFFGCGPASFMAYAYGLMGDVINDFWPTLTIIDVHNEWFNAVLSYGIAGGIAYLGIFVSAAYCLLKSALEENRAVMFGLGLAVISYIAHNIFCYQQIIGTSLIFIFMGIGAAKLRGNRSKE